MNTLGAAVLLVAVAAAYAGLAVPIDSAAVITGPSGQVVRSGLAAGLIGPAAIGGPLGYAAAPLGARLAVGAPYAAAAVAPAVPLAAAQAALSLSVPAGSGLEGQWIPDINEKLYEDGSYKPYIYGL